MFYEIAKNYSFHDTQINKIITTKQGVVLFFNNGVYSINETSNGGELTAPCKVSFEIDNFDINRIFQHVEIIKQGKLIRKNIGFSDFAKLVNKYNFRILLDYYCLQLRIVRLEGCMNEHDITLTIMDINDINFFYDD